MHANKAGVYLSDWRHPHSWNEHTMSDSKPVMKRPMHSARDGVAIRRTWGLGTIKKLSNWPSISKGPQGKRAFGGSLVASKYHVSKIPPETPRWQ
jgi:hypothetical protein